MEGPWELLHMVMHLQTVQKEIFPMYGGRRHLDAHKFDQMLDHLRRMFWNHRQTPIRSMLTDIVKERPPIGSRFVQETGEYFTPNGMFVNKEMREAVKLLRGGFQEAHHYQDRLYNQVLLEAQGQEEAQKKGIEVCKNMQESMKDYKFTPKPEDALTAAEWKGYYNLLIKKWHSEEESEN